MTPSDSSRIAPPPGIYIWDLPAKHIAVHLNLDVVDRMLQDVMRGFGAVPRRGAEVGGILLGTSDRRDKLTVAVNDYQLAPIQYKRGPSYLLSDDDNVGFSNFLDQLRANQDPSRLPVGYFRSHTRDGIGLSSEDLELLARYFPRPDAVALLVRPFASKVSIGGFYFRQDGAFPAATAPLLEFPFRRKELASEELPPAPPPPPERRESRPVPPPPSIAPPPLPPLPRELATVPLPAPKPPALPLEPVYQPSLPEPAPEPSGGWLWPLLSVAFLLVGGLAGFFASQMLNPQPAQDPASLFSLSLTVSRTGDNLYVKWDRQAAAIRAAEHGALFIEDGTFAKTLELDASQLQNGSVVYRHYSSGVRFMLQVSLNSRETITEAVDWKE